jgi:predicted nucleotidyltransferase
VEFAPDAMPSLLDMARMEIELSEMLGGLTVDLRTAEELSRYFRQDVVDSAELFHAA